MYRRTEHTDSVPPTDTHGVDCIYIYMLGSTYISSCTVVRSGGGVEPGKEKEANETLEETQENTSPLSSFSLLWGRRHGVVLARCTAARRRAIERRYIVVPASGRRAGSFWDRLDNETEYSAVGMVWEWRYQYLHRTTTSVPSPQKIQPAAHASFTFKYACDVLLLAAGLAVI